ncbi:MAG: hypothetical protein IJF35_02460 [Clostridia bacterium]|nr:hypothetical protein [Clostridia bacterium]
MIYPKLEIKKEKKFAVDDFSCGTNKTRENAAIYDSENMIYSAGGLKNRPSTELTEEKPFYEENPLCKNEAQLCQATIFLDGEYYKVAVFSSEEKDMRMLYHFHLLSERGKAIKIASLEFAHTSNDAYLRPESITVFSAVRNLGCGVYAYVSVYNQLAENREDAYALQVYELSTDMNNWIALGKQDMYIPKYYVNGRGIFHDDTTLKLPEPEYKEPINMLNNSFQCTYTSDGLSTRFYLPENIIEDGKLERFNCKVYLDDGEMLDFELRPEANNSKPIIYNGEQIFITFIPSMGYLSFVNYVPPHVRGKENNIVITVTIKKPENDIKLASVNKSIWFSSRESGAYLCLAGNKYNPSQICVSAKDNPFYFPEENCYLVGDPSQKITALARQNKALVIFKEKEIYCADCASNKFAVTHLHANIGCDLPETVALCENRLVWANSDNKVYTLNALSDYGAVSVYGMSRAIDEELAEEDFSFATSCYCNRQYFLFLKNRAYVLDLSGAILQSNREFVTAAAWFRWSFSEDISIKAAYAANNSVNLICSVVGNNSYYMARLKGTDGTDTFFDALLNIQKKVVESSLTTGLFYDDNYFDKKIFTKLFANIFAERDVFVDFVNEMGDSVKNTVINIKYNGKKTLSAYRVLPLVRCLGIAVKLRAHGNIKLNKLTFVYKETV